MQHKITRENEIENVCINFAKSQQFCLSQCFKGCHYVDFLCDSENQTLSAGAPFANMV